MGRWLPFWILGAPLVVIILDWMVMPKGRSTPDGRVTQPR